MNATRGSSGDLGGNETPAGLNGTCNKTEMTKVKSASIPIPKRLSAIGKDEKAADESEEFIDVETVDSPEREKNEESEVETEETEETATEQTEEQEQEEVKNCAERIANETLDTTDIL